MKNLVIRNTPLFNLKKNYEYDLDHNIIFYKNNIEKIEITYRKST